MDSHNESLIEVRDLRRVYQMGRTAVNALAGVTLDVPEGAFRAVMGPSGSGKSTLLNLIGGLDRATTGVLRVASQEITALDENGLALYRQRWGRNGSARGRFCWLFSRAILAKTRMRGAAVGLYPTTCASMIDNYEVDSLVWR